MSSIFYSPTTNNALVRGFESSDIPAVKAALAAALPNVRIVEFAAGESDWFEIWPSVPKEEEMQDDSGDEEQTDEGVSDKDFHEYLKTVNAPPEHHKIFRDSINGKTLYNVTKEQAGYLAVGHDVHGVVHLKTGKRLGNMATPTGVHSHKRRVSMMKRKFGEDAIFSPGHGFDDSTDEVTTSGATGGLTSYNLGPRVTSVRRKRRLRESVDEANNDQVKVLPPDAYVPTLQDVQVAYDVYRWTDMSEAEIKRKVEKRFGVPLVLDPMGRVEWVKGMEIPPEPAPPQVEESGPEDDEDDDRPPI